MEPNTKRNPITVEAFRFVQLKTPDLFTGKSMTINFISHPAPQNSFILNSTDNKSDDNDGETENFLPYNSLRDLQQVNPTLYEFMFWLRENRGKLDASTLWNNAAEIEPLHSEQVLNIWENLFYQTQSNSNTTIVEGLVRILQTNHFITYYKNIEDPSNPDTFPIQKLEQAAKATVLLPHQLFNRNDSSGNPSSKSIDGKSKQILTNQLKQQVNQYHIALYTEALEEITTIEQAYFTDNSMALQQAQQEYRASVIEWEKVNLPRVNEKGERITATDELGLFEYQPAIEWNENYLQEKISENSWSIYQLFRKEQHKTINDTQQAIKDEVNLLMRQQIHLLQESAVQTFIHKGIQFTSRTRPLNNSYIFSIQPLAKQPNLYTIYLTQYHENDAARILKIEANLQTSEGNASETVITKALHKTAHYTTMQLFPEGIEVNDDQTMIQVNGYFETQDAQYSNGFNYEARPNSIIAAKNNTTNLAEDSLPLSNIFGVMSVKIAEFKKVNQTLCCYTEGEVSHIENILAKEYKERSTRNLIRTEITNEKTTERETENLSDTTSTDRHEIQSEIALMLQEQQSKNLALSASVGGTYSFGGGSHISINTNATSNTSSSSSSSSNFNEAEAYAKELTQRAMQRLVEKTTSKRTSKMLREFEETNKHGFDNREGDKHVTGVYRWVDKIYQNELVNYGKRLLYEFMLPEPAKNYKHLLQKNIETGNTQGCDTILLQKPLSPQEMGIMDHQDITEANFGAIAAYYKLEIEEGYPIQFQRIAKSFTENFYTNGSDAQNDAPLFHVSKNFDFELPEHYICTHFHAQFVARRHGGHNDINGNLLIGDVAADLDSDSEYIGVLDGSAVVTPNHRGARPVLNAPTFTHVEGNLPISLAAEDIGVFAMTVWANCALKPEALNQWKARLFSTINTAYEEMLQQYNDALYEQCMQRKQDQAASDNPTVPNYNINPLMARRIERQEIKRIIIEQIMQKVYAVKYAAAGTNPIGYNNYLQDSLNNTLNVNRNSGFYRDQMKYAKFLEQAFEWDIMAYTFLPYYWADEKEWGDLLSLDTAADAIFLAFLQAGMVDITLPVRTGLEKSVAFLLETGLLWRGDGFVVDGQDDLYPAIEEQMQLEVDAMGNEIKYDSKGNAIPVVEATWETRIPSTLNIVQTNSNPIDGDGLPCFCEEDNSNAIGFSSTGQYNLLQRGDVE